MFVAASLSLLLAAAPQGQDGAKPILNARDQKTLADKLKKYLAAEIAYDNAEGRAREKAGKSRRKAKSAFNDAWENAEKKDTEDNDIGEKFQSSEKDDKPTEDVTSEPDWSRESREPSRKDKTRRWGRPGPTNARSPVEMERDRRPPQNGHREPDGARMLYR